MKYFAVVQARGKELDYLRGEAFRVAQDARTDWYAEPGNFGTAFYFETADVRTRFCAICKPNTSNMLPNPWANRGRAMKVPKVAKTKSKKRPTPKPYTAADIKLLKQHSKARTPVSKITKLMKRTEGSLRQKALKLGFGLGHQR